MSYQRFTWNDVEIALKSHWNYDVATIFIYETFTLFNVISTSFAIF